MDFEDWRHRRHLVHETTSWDFLLAQSEFCAEALRVAFRYEGRILDVGYPRNDVLRSPQAEQVRANTRAQLGIAANQRAVLYAPTWRDAFRVGRVWQKVLYLDSRRLIDSDPDLVLLVRGHYHTIRAAETADADSRILDVTRYPDIALLYLTADVLITDYSSVFFDFALTQRPMLFLVPDLEHYRTAQRGLYLDFEEVVPGPVLADTDAVVEALRGPDRYAAHRREFVDRFAPRDDGHASRRVVEAVFGTGHLSSVEQPRD
jgi:CDP-glycerol glycerophosphotransferase